MTSAVKTVGMVGLGIMGHAMSMNLVKAGFHVVGFDIDPARCVALGEVGGEALASAQAVAAQAQVVISVLPSIAALDSTVAAVAAAAHPGLVFVECSTLPIADKLRAHDVLAAVGVPALDCTLSGTGAQTRVKDVAVYASGDKAVIDACRPVFDGFARVSRYVGPYGNGSKMKFVANLLVSIHNASAAEAFVLGMKAGLDPQLILDVVADGAGGSRMFTIRGPMMVEGRYDEATMKVDMWQKDVKIITEFARELDCPTPLFAASAQLYSAAMAQGCAKHDTAVVCAVLEQMAGHVRDKR
jgi:L-threonate 2-dehydrogenase